MDTAPTSDATRRTAPSGRPSRRRLVAATSWLAPAAISSVAAPALAASCAHEERVGFGWRRATRTGSPSATAPFTSTITISPLAGDRVESRGTVPPGAPAPLTVRATHRFSGRMRGASGNGTFVDEGGPAANPDIFYEIRQQNGPSGTTAVNPATDYQEVTFTLSRPIRAFIFSIARIDQSSSGSTNMRDALDGVSVTSSVGYRSVQPAIQGETRNSIVTGTGSIADPWRSLALDNETISLRGQIDVFFAEDAYLQEFTIRVANLSPRSNPSNNTQRVAVRGFIGWRTLC